MITRRQSALGLSAFALFGLSACGGDDEPAAKKPCEIKESELRDRLRGMMRLSAFADALGAQHELSGLDGNVGPYSEKKALGPLSGYGRGKQTATPFGVWVNPKDPKNHPRIGIPTDDTSIRMALIYPWLCSLKGKAPTEASLREFLKKVANGPEGATDWTKTRKRAAAAIDAAIGDAAAYKKAVKGLKGDAVKEVQQGFKPSPGNSFYKPGAPVIFGPFFFLELAILTPCCPTKDVFARAAGFTCLDQGDGRLVSGALGAVMAAAPCPGAKTGDFASFFFKTAGRALTGHGGKRGKALKEEMDAARKIGRDRRAADKAAGKPDPKGFLDQIEKDIYRKRNGEDGGLFKFDPVRFLKMYAATLEYAQGDIARAIRLLSCSAGDADTMPALLAAMMGAWCGEAALKKDAAVATGMDTVEKRLKEMGGVDMNKFVDCLIALARRSDCCRIVK